MQAITVDLTKRYSKLTPDLIGVETKFSLQPFITYLEKKITTEKTSKRSIYTYILDQFRGFPELKDPIPPENIQNYAPLFELIYTSLSPIISEEREHLWGLSAPVSPTFYFGTQAFYDVLVDPLSQQLKPGLGLPEISYMRNSLLKTFYNLVLEQYYGFSLTGWAFTIKSIVDPNTQLLKYYRLHVNNSFLKIHTEMELPQLKLENLKDNLKEEPSTINLLQRLLPPDQFSIEGFSVIEMIDVTAEYALESIKNVIIAHNECATASYDTSISTALKTIAGTNALEFGLLPYIKLSGKTLLNLHSGFKSILLTYADQQNGPDEDGTQLLDEYLINPRSLVFPEITELEQKKYPMLRLLYKNGVRSYALFPLYYNGKLVGCLEIYAKDPSFLTARTLSQIEVSFSLLAQLFQNVISDFHNEITRVITSKFTSIQPAVQWRFNEAAYHYLKHDCKGKDLPIEPIYFENVQPFYAAIDIKDSSISRNLAIRKDLDTYFKLLEKTFTAIQAITKSEVMSSLPNKEEVWNYKKESQLSDSQIVKIEDYLIRQLPPYLRALRDAKPEVKDIIDDYFEQTSPDGPLFINRNLYEHSMQTLNRSINSMLDVFNTEIQTVFPCYFEKFRTDGVEFDIYLGQSIAPDLAMPEDIFQTFRFKHLLAVAKIAHAAHNLIPSLSLPLQTTQLIFVHEKLIDISFRRDEQRFDVEGSYNIRYQLVKKRIDKAHIKFTDQRLTQPGKLAIVYLNNWEAEEYLKYFNILIEQNILKNDVEFVEIEELQGVEGLKALRVSLNFEELPAENIVL
jgi:hypothetical protein